MPLYRRYIKRPRKVVLNPVNNYDYLNDYSYDKDKTYHIKEFHSRYQHKLVRFLKDNHYDFITSRHIGITDIPFISFNTENYGYGITRTFYYPVVKFSLSDVMKEYDIHDPIGDTFVKFQAPYEIIVKHMEGYDVLVGYTAACFIYALQYLLNRRIHLPLKPCPKNRVRYYLSMRDRSYDRLAAEKILSYIKVFAP